MSQKHKLSNKSIKEQDISQYSIEDFLKQISDSPTDIIPERSQPSYTYPERPSFAPATIENTINSARLQQFGFLTRELLQLIADSDFEYGYGTAIDIFLKNRLAENALATKDWLNSVFIENFNDVSIVTGILRTIAHLDYDDIMPQGPTMSLAALTHSNVEVRECGIRTFENWANLDCLKILKTITPAEKWLQEYVSKVISDLEEELL